MSLKKVVNDKEQWDALNTFYDDCIARYHKLLEQETNVVNLHQTQGAIAAVRKLKQMRDIVNGQ